MLNSLYDLPVPKPFTPVNLSVVGILCSPLSEAETERGDRWWLWQRATLKKELKSSQRRNEHMRVEESGGWDKWESRAVDAVGGNSDWHPVWKPVVSACDEPEPDMFKVEASFHSSPCLRLSKKWNGLTSSVAESRPVTQLGLCRVPVQDERDGFSPVSVWVLGPLYCNSIKGFRGSLCPRGPPLFSFFVFSDQLDKQL